MGDFDYKLRIEYAVQSGRKKFIDTWAKKHDTYVMYDLFDPFVYFTSMEDLTMFKLEFGGEYVEVDR
jgi:hypothetical protein